MYYKKVSGNLKENIVAQIESAKNIIITSHISPDDDSIASVLTMYSYITEYLKISSKKVRMIISEERSLTRWKYFKNYEKINFIEDIESELPQTDLLIALDGSGWKRFSRDSEVRSKFNGKVICLDHHPVPEDIFDTHLVATKYSSTSVLLYYLFFKKEKLEKTICETILLGLIGDTGRFKYIDSGKVESFEVAKRLVLDGGINIEDFLSKFETIPLNVYKIFALLINKSVVREVDGWPNFIISFITRNEIQNIGYAREDVSLATALFAEILKNFREASWGLVFSSDSKGNTNVSGRSLPGSVSVRHIMQSLKIGGGHDRAAGGKILEEDMEKAIEFITNWMMENKPLIV